MTQEQKEFAEWIGARVRADFEALKKLPELDDVYRQLEEKAMTEETTPAAAAIPPVDFLTLAGSAFERIFRLGRLLGKNGYQWLEGRTHMTLVISDRVYQAIQEHQLFQTRRAGRLDLAKSIRTGELTVHEGLWTFRLVAEGRIAPIPKGEDPAAGGDPEAWEKLADLSKDPEFMAREAEKLRNTKVESPIQDAIFGEKKEATP